MGIFRLSKDIGYGMRRLTRLGTKVRSIRHWWQRRTRGWDDSDTWALDAVIAKFALPRLKRFKELSNCYPGIEPMDTPEKWDAALDEMIWALEYTAKDEGETREEEERCAGGLRLFGEWFGQLGW